MIVQFYHGFPQREMAEVINGLKPHVGKVQVKTVTKNHQVIDAPFICMPHQMQMMHDDAADSRQLFNYLKGQPGVLYLGNDVLYPDWCIHYPMWIFCMVPGGSWDKLVASLCNKRLSTDWLNLLEDVDKSVLKRATKMRDYTRIKGLPLGLTAHLEGCPACRHEILDWAQYLIVAEEAGEMIAEVIGGSIREIIEHIRSQGFRPGDNISPN